MSERNIQGLLEFVAKGLVESQDDVEVRQLDTTLFELRVAEDDRGKVIGKKGRTAHAIRSLLAAVSPGGESPVLEIVD